MYIGDGGYFKKYGSYESSRSLSQYNKEYDHVEDRYYTPYEAVTQLGQYSNKQLGIRALLSILAGGFIYYMNSNYYQILEEPLDKAIPAGLAVILYFISIKK